MAAIFTLLGCSGGSQADFEGPYKHVLLISLDTTRADALACYGGTAARTPRLDRLAASGVRFADVTAPAPSTLSSHTSIMTGLYPRRHGVARNGFMIHGDNVLLAEVLQQAGFHTAGFIGSFALDELFGFNQGFDHWDQEFSIEFDPRYADQNQRPAEQVTDAVLAHVGNYDGSDRLFLFAHYFDVHSPYAPPEPFLSEYAKSWMTSDFGVIERQVTLHQERLTGKQFQIYSDGIPRSLASRADGEMIPGDDNLAALYAGELAHLDDQVGRLLDGLEERGILQDCIVILTADHGETFWEHGDFWHHGAWVYQTNVDVPLIIQLPDGRGAGSVVSQPVSSVDIYPTVLGLLGLSLPEPVAGVDLSTAIDGMQMPLRALFTEATQPVSSVLEGKSKWANQYKTKAIRKGRWKYIQAPYISYEELYDLQTDPAERHNLMEELTPELKEVLRSLQQELVAWILVEEGRPSEFNATQIDAVLKRLEALGYTGDGGGASPDPGKQ